MNAMTVCPRCNGRNLVKNGFMQGKPRKKCKDCNYNFTRSTPRGKPKEIKRLALHMYLEGLGFRSIGRILGVSNVAILKWLKEISGKVADIRAVEEAGSVVVRTMELDEMRHYVGEKNEKFGSGLLLIETRKKYLPGSSVLVERRA